MYFSLLIMLLNSFLIHADPPGARAAERTQEDQQIDDECAPRMKLGVDHYAECVAEKGREAERRRAEARRLMEINEGPEEVTTPQLVCNPDGAVSFCSRSSEAAARANNPSSSVQQITVALQSCRAACNPDSSIVLRNYLNGCRGDLSAQKRLMTQTRNNCGTGTVSETVVDSLVSSVPQDVRNMLTSDMSFTDKLNASAQRLIGYSWDSAGETTNTYGKFASTRLSDGINYVQSETSQGTLYQYCKGEKCYSSYEAARAGGFSDAGGSAVFPKKAQLIEVVSGRTDSGVIDESEDVPPKLQFGEVVSGAPPAEPEYPVGTIAPGESSGSPSPQAGNAAPPAAGGDGNGNNNGSSSDTTSAGNNGDQQVVTPVNPNETNYQAGNFAGLQSAMSSPAGGGMASSSSSGGEVSRGGSSGGGSFPSPNGGTRPLAFEGSGQVSPSALGGSDLPAARAGTGSPAMDVAAPVGSSRGGGFAGFGGGSMIAAARTGPASLESSLAAPMRSDSFYRTGSGGAVARVAGRPTAPCKGPNCPKPARARAAGIAAANCDGNPQCLLALTGKLQLPRRQGAGSEEFLQADSGGVRRARANTGERGVASVPKRTEPGGVVRGKILDVLNHLGSSEIFKLDHDGMLEVDL